jgi:transmembrane sensor
MKSSTKQLEHLRAQQASAWIEALRNPTRDDEAAFVAWLKESPRNVREFLLMWSVDRALDDLDSKRQHDIESLLAHVDRRAVTISQPLDARVTEREPGRMWRWGAIAACLLVMPLAGWVMLTRGGSAWKEFETATGEQRAFELDDGSVIDLNTHSRIGVRFLRQEREVRLLEGEALFRVHHDTARPFRVYTGDAVVQAIGTQFDIYKRVNGTVVSVLEGRVSVTAEPPAAPSELPYPSAIQHPASGQEVPRQAAVSLSLGTSEEAQITPAGFVSVRSVTNVSDAVAWRERRLVFRQQTLEHIAGEFNRYSRKQIRLEGADIRNRVYSGVFDADDIDSLVQVLMRDADLVVEPSDFAIVVRAR